MHHIYKIMIKTSILSINVKHNINISNYTQFLQIYLKHVTLNFH
jgi:hypothetical protein